MIDIRIVVTSQVGGMRKATSVLYYSMACSGWWLPWYVQLINFFQPVHLRFLYLHSNKNVYKKGSSHDRHMYNMIRGVKNLREVVEDERRS